MYQQCEIVQDLLPLYADEACSASSAAMIREHLEICPACRALYEKLCSDCAEEALKAEMAEVIASREKLMKRIRIFEIVRSVVITSVVVLLVICVLAWRFWPHSSSGIIPVDKDEISSFASGLLVQRLENGKPVTESYTFDNTELWRNASEEILEILATSDYRQDFRNLLPWEPDVVEADKNFDGRSALLVFSVGNQLDDWVQINYMSSTMIVVKLGWEDGRRIYHPTNEKTLDDLIEYFQAYGVQQ